MEREITQELVKWKTGKRRKQFCKRYVPTIGYKCTLKNIGEHICEQTRTVSLPLYLVWNWERYL